MRRRISGKRGGGAVTNMCNTPFKGTFPSLIVCLYLKTINVNVDCMWCMIKSRLITCMVAWNQHCHRLCSLQVGSVKDRRLSATRYSTLPTCISSPLSLSSSTTLFSLRSSTDSVTRAVVAQWCVGLQTFAPSTVFPAPATISLTHL